MQRRRLGKRASFLVVLTVLQVACEDSSTEPAERNSDANLGYARDAKDPFGAIRVTEIISSENPPSGPIRVGDYLTVEFIGKGKLIDEAPELPRPSKESVPTDDGSRETRPGAARYGEVGFHVFNPVTGNEFSLVFQQPLLDAVHAFQEARGLTGATEGLKNPEESERPSAPQSVRRHGATPLERPTKSKGWSNATDSRALLTATTSWPWRTISQHGSGDSGCTSTLIGPRHLITAAHCINKRGTSQWYTVRVDPGRNGLNESPYGSSTISVNPPPGTSAWYFTPASWRTQWCVDNPYTCTQWDWGMIVIPDRLGDLTGWMGYVAVSASDLNTRTHYNRGYPKCNTSKPNRPALCDLTINGQNIYWARLFGDTNPCVLGGYHYPGPDGWNRVIRNSCDLSAGHSGSPVYHYRFDSALNSVVPVVSMVVAWEECYTCAPGTNYPNLARRITPGDLGIISWLRKVFP